MDDDEFRAQRIREIWDKVWSFLKTCSKLMWMKHVRLLVMFALLAGALMSMAMYLSVPFIQDRPQAKLRTTRGFHARRAFNMGLASYAPMGFIGVLCMLLAGILIIGIVVDRRVVYGPPPVIRYFGTRVFSILVFVVIAATMLSLRNTDSVRRSRNVVKRYEMFVSNNIDPAVLRHVSRQIKSSDGTTSLMLGTLSNAVVRVCAEHYRGFLQTKRTILDRSKAIQLFAMSMFTGRYLGNVARSMSSADPTYKTMVYELIKNNTLTNFAIINRYRDTSRYLAYLNPGDTISGIGFEHNVLPAGMPADMIAQIKTSLARLTARHDSLLLGVGGGPFGHVTAMYGTIIGSCIAGAVMTLYEPL